MTVATEVPTDDLVACTRQQLEGMGYSVEVSDVEPGVVHARRRISGLGYRVLGQSQYSAMIADVDEPPAGPTYSLSVFTIAEENWGLARDSYEPPTEDGEDEARLIVAARTPDAPENPLRPDPVG